jgi:hypothetical protein
MAPLMSALSALPELLIYFHRQQAVSRLPASSSACLSLIAILAHHTHIHQADHHVGRGELLPFFISSFPST